MLISHLKSRVGYLEKKGYERMSEKVNEKNSSWDTLEDSKHSKLFSVSHEGPNCYQGEGKHW